MSQHLAAYLFPGQGSQYVGMGRDLRDSFPEARAVFAQADDVLGFSLSRLCFEGPQEELDDTINTQPAVLTVSVAMLRVLEQRTESRPAFVAGHSMGEFSALVAGGALTFEDGLRLVRERGRLMKRADEHSPGGMAAVLGLEREAMEAVCIAARQATGQYVGIANDNCPGQVVISGALEALAWGMEAAGRGGARRVVQLPISIAAHSPLMAEVAAEFRQRLGETMLSRPAIPVVANATAGPVTEPEAIRDALGHQLTSPVRWAESVRWMMAQGVTRFVEVGPKEVLTGLVRRIDRGVEGLTIAQALGWEA